MPNIWQIAAANGDERLNSPPGEQRWAREGLDIGAEKREEILFQFSSSPPPFFFSLSLRAVGGFVTETVAKTAEPAPVQETSGVNYDACIYFPD